jgi:hypothetical protein
MDLQFGNPFPGTIANVSTLNVGGLLENAASISVSNAILIATNGTLAGNPTIASPGLIVNGALSPGVNGVGAITNSGGATFGAGGTYSVAVQNAAGAPGAGWNFLQTGGALSVQASNPAPFVISLQSLAGGQLGAVTNFNYNTNFDWVIATASGGITNFAPNKFAVDTTLFQNDLAGGYFYVRTNGGSLVLSFSNNLPPSAATAAFYRTGSVMAIPVASLTNGWSDPNGDPVALYSVNSSSTNGAGVGTDGSFIYYTNVNNVADEVLYKVYVVRTNPPAVYQPDDTVLTAVGTIIILPPPAFGGFTVSGANLIVGGAGGIGGGNYVVLASTNLAQPVGQWITVATNNFDTNGNFIFSNPAAPGPARSFYRLKVP